MLTESVHWLSPQRLLRHCGSRLTDWIPHNAKELFAPYIPRNRRRRCVAQKVPPLIIVIFCGVPASAWAANDFADLSLEELMQVPVPTITSASRFAQKATDAPASITVITKDEIRRFGYRTLAEVLQSARGLHVTSEGRYSYAGVRGFNLPGDFKAGLLLLIDGHRANENIYGTALLGTEGLVDVDLIDHVEIVRGPASAIYGKGAFYGVINVVTRRPDDFRQGEVSTSIGDHETYKARATLGHHFKNGFEYLLSGSFFESTGRENIFFQDFDSPATHNGIAHHLEYDHGRDVLLKMAYGDFSLEGVYKWRMTGIPDGAFGVTFNDPLNRQRDKLGYVELKYTHDFDGWAVESRTSINHYSYNGYYPYFGDPNDPTRVVLNLDDNIGTWWMGELQVSRQWQKHHFALGADFQDNLQQDQNNFDVDPRIVYADSNVTSFEYGVFVQDEFRLNDMLTFTGAGRYDWYTGYGGDLSARLGVIYQPIKKTSIKLLYGDAFRSPTVYEAYYQLTGQDMGSRLGPERIHSYEAVLEQELRSNLRLTVTGFYNRIDDLIQSQQGPDGLTFSRNGDSVNTGGAEVELEARGPYDIRTRVSYAYQQSNYVRVGAELINSPRHLAKLNLIVPFFDDKVSLGFELQGVSSARTLAGNKTDPYVVSNVTLFSRRLIKNLEFSASIYNVFDQHYEDPAGSGFTQDVHIQPGRSFRAKLTYSF
jgi:outer membrane receptor for ferrienterochelin and colicin